MFVYSHLAVLTRCISSNDGKKSATNPGMVNKTNSRNAKKSIRNEHEPALTIYPVNKIDFLKQAKEKQKTKTKTENLNKNSIPKSENAPPKNESAVKTENNNKSEILSSNKIEKKSTNKLSNAQNEKIIQEILTIQNSNNEKVL